MLLNATLSSYHLSHTALFYAALFFRHSFAYHPFPYRPFQERTAAGLPLLSVIVIPPSPLRPDNGGFTAAQQTTYAKALLPSENFTPLRLPNAAFSPSVVQRRLRCRCPTENKEKQERDHRGKRKATEERGIIISSCRKIHGLSQEDLAKKAGFSRLLISVSKRQGWHITFH